MAANDRVKFLFTWLQAACARAEAPEHEPPDLASERRAVGIEEEALDRALALARAEAGGYAVPGVGQVLERMLGEVDLMLAPLAAADMAGGFADRRRLLGERLRGQGDAVSAETVRTATRARRDEGDSLHLLVMDLHKALNGLQASIAEESVDGAKVYGIAPEDRDRIAAFMRGLNRTAPLKFDHPGLGTTATRAGRRLMLQNDIGTTDAHVLIVNVEDRRMSVTYTDVHNRRLRFFIERLRSFAVRWSEPQARRALGLEEEDFYVTTGIYDAPDLPSLDACLEQLGAGLVFLIDWNRARKRLRSLLPKAEAVALLGWAADHELGHRAFLVLGGDRLIFDLLDSIPGRPGGLGQRLDDLLGEEQAVEFLRFVLRTASEGLRAGRSDTALFEECRADLMLRLNSAADRMIELVIDHGAITLDIANLVREALLRGASPATLGAAARRCKQWESSADHLLTRLRGLAERSSDAPAWRAIASAADDVADSLEEAMFNLSILPGIADGGELADALGRLAALLVGGVQDYIRAVAATRHLHRGAQREELRHFLDCLERLRAMEHATDQAERDVVVALCSGPVDPRKLFLATAAAAQLEGAGDALLHAGLMLGDHVLGERLRS